MENLTIFPSIQQGGKVGIELMWEATPPGPSVWVSLEELAKNHGVLPAWVLEDLGIETAEGIAAAVTKAINEAKDLQLELLSSTH